MAYSIESLQRAQYLIGLEAAYTANDAFDDIRANGKQIEEWEVARQSGLYSEEHCRDSIEHWQQIKEFSEAQFTAFELVAGAMIGRSAPGLERYPQLRGAFLPPEKEIKVA